MSIKALKKEAKKGVLKKSKYRLELFVPGQDSSSLSVMCQSVSFPARNITPVKIHHKGRPLLLRSETEFGDSIDVTFLDNGRSEIRRIMDFWLNEVDNPNLNSTIPASDDPMSGINSIKDEIKAGIGLFNDIKNAVKNPRQIFDLIGQTDQFKFPQYQTAVRIWQLDGQERPVYGYELQNAFIQGIAASEFSASDNELQNITITLAYSEVQPLKSSVVSTIDKVLGTDFDKFPDFPKL